MWKWRREERNTIELGEVRDCSCRALLKSNLFVGSKAQYLFYREWHFFLSWRSTCETCSLVMSSVSEDKLYRLQQGKRTCNACKIPVWSCSLPGNYAPLYFNVSPNEVMVLWLAVTSPIIPSSWSLGGKKQGQNTPFHTAL